MERFEYRKTFFLKYSMRAGQTRAGQTRTGSYFGTRAPSDYAYGTIKYKAPPKGELPAGRSRSYSYSDLSRMYSKNTMNDRDGGRGGTNAGTSRSGKWNWDIGNGRGANNETSSDRGSRYRIGRVQTHAVPLNSLLTPQKGSFQRLKDLIWNERAREEQQQRRNGDLIARAAALQDLTKGER